MHRSLVIALLMAPSLAAAQALNPMAIPPALDLDTFDLTVDEHVHQFYPGINTNTYGVNGPYLGPTLILHQGDTAHFRIHNELAQVTSMHWHGLAVPGEMDGGPPREVEPGETWEVKYKVKNPAGTYWYHPHPHMLTAFQATQGVAGMLLVKDAAEAAIDLPRTYGIDDFPVVVQDRRFLPGGNFFLGPYGDSVLVNGTPRPFLECPAQVVRLRLLNGSNSRIYALGFEDGRQFRMIAGDGGLLSAPVAMQRLWLGNGERAEVLLDLTGMEGDSLLLMSYGSELPVTVPGSDNMMMESSILNGVDFPVLRIRVGAPTADPVTAIPNALVPVIPYDEGSAVRTRTKLLTGTGMVGSMGMFFINGVQFDMDVVNDTVLLGSTEIWNIQNFSNMAHPMHIHGGSFYILDRDGQSPPAWERGAKDVVLLDAGSSARVIMRFDEPTNGWPFMYHCHNLMHEDNMMMLQYIVTDVTTSAPGMQADQPLRVFPSPAVSLISIRAEQPFRQAELFTLQGCRVRNWEGVASKEAAMDLSDLPAGAYLLRVSGNGHTARTTVIRE